MEINGDALLRLPEGSAGTRPTSEHQRTVENAARGGPVRDEARQETRQVPAESRKIDIKA